MPTPALTNVLLVAIVAFLAPLLASAIPRVRVPSVVVEIIAGIIIGPSGLGWGHIDLPISVLSLFGLAFLLFLAGLEVELERLQGAMLRLVLQAFAGSVGIALLIGVLMYWLGIVRSPLFIAIVLATTALGIVTSIIADTGETASTFGQVVIASASVAEFGTIILLSLFFSEATTSIGAKVIVLGGFAVLATVVILVIFRVDHVTHVTRIFVHLQDTTAQIRIRGAFALLTAFVVLAQGLGLEIILGAFTAGAVLRLIDHDTLLTHPQFRQKLEAVGYGIFIPVFFIATGIQVNLPIVFMHMTTLALVPAFLLGILFVRGVPALLYAPLIGQQRVLPAALLQATSLSFIVTASQIGISLGVVTKATATAFILAGVLSVLIFPTLALRQMRSTMKTAKPYPATKGHVI